ncbi:HNH homing endonuclease [Enterococcus phage EF-P10]|nr:HNH homing endonuclease [Enterococcus phage EF-P10]
MKENWKVIKGYPLYEVSDLGRVRRISTGKVLKQSNNIDGYKVVTLYNNKVPRQFRVHRLVAMEFIPNPEDKPVVNHLDEVVYNNGGKQS